MSFICLVCDDELDLEEMYIEEEVDNVCLNCYIGALESLDR